MVATAIYSVTMVLWKEIAVPLCRAMERRWKRNVVSQVSSVIVVIRLPISCVSSMAISCHVPYYYYFIVFCDFTGKLESHCLADPEGTKKMHPPLRYTAIFCPWKIQPITRSLALCLENCYNQKRLSDSKCQTEAHDSRSNPSTVRKNKDILQDIWKKYRTFDRTSEAYFATVVGHYCISAVFEK